MKMTEVKKKLFTEKKAGKKGRRKAAVVMAMVALNVFMFAMPVFAAVSSNSGADVVNSKMSVLYNIIAAFVSSYGGIQVLWGVFEWGNATNTQDGMMQSQSVKRIGGGLIMTVASQLVTVLLA